MSKKPDDGTYYAEGRAVFRAPKATKHADGSTTYTMGFRVCVVDEHVTEGAAAFIAAAMNAMPHDKE